jgi:hypothetical protein
VREHRPGVVEEHATSIRQIDSARLSAEQLDIELELYLLDALAEWRLLHAEFFGRAGDVAFLGDREKVPQVFEIKIHIDNDIDFAEIIGYLDGVDLGSP